MTDTEIIVEPGRHDIVIKRVFDGPPELVYRAFTDTESIARWMGRDVDTTVVETNELRHGGRWRFLSSGSDGEKHAFRGVYHDLVLGERITQTWEWEGLPGHVALETATFTEIEGGRTQYVGVSVYQSIEDRDGMASSGMEVGVNEGFDKIDQIVEEMKN